MTRPHPILAGALAAVLALAPGAALAQAEEAGDLPLVPLDAPLGTFALTEVSGETRTIGWGPTGCEMSDTLSAMLDEELSWIRFAEAAEGVGVFEYSIAFGDGWESNEPAGSAILLGETFEIPVASIDAGRLTRGAWTTEDGGLRMQGSEATFAGSSDAADWEAIEATMDELVGDAFPEQADLIGRLRASLADPGEAGEEAATAAARARGTIGGKLFIVEGRAQDDLAIAGEWAMIGWGSLGCHAASVGAGTWAARPWD